MLSEFCHISLEKLRALVVPLSSAFSLSPRCRAVAAGQPLAFPLLLAACAGLGLWSRADPVQLRPAQPLTNGTALLCPGTGYAIPCVTDWNGDGKKDLLVGYQTAGKIALYLNVGTDAQPRFDNFTNLQTTDGADICLPSSGCGAPAPWACDFYADGKRDLLVGSGSDGTVWFYRNTGTDAAPQLAPGVRLLAGGAPLSVGLRATPLVYDWDRDGLPDLLCGSGDGYVYFFKNTNTVQSPAFAPAVRIRAGGSDLFLGIRSVVRVFDWDGDGLVNLVCSSDSGVYWCRNTNSNSQPILQPPQAIRAPLAGSGLVPINTGGRMRLDLADWNNDGVIDLVLGNLNGTVYLYQGYRFQIRRAIALPANQVALEWDSAPFLTYNILCGPSLPALATPAATNLPSAGNTTAWTNPATAGCQFYRLQIAH